tara:strand:+ start:374 stop:568 length:195 start_codon:yes stop_codon:yes gene_type:complete
MQEVLKGAGAATQGALESLPIESIPSPLPPAEPESGLSWTTGLGIAAIVLILAAALVKSKCCKK